MSDEVLYVLGNLFKTLLKGATLRVWVPAIVVVLLPSATASAAVDFSLGGTFRSYPLSAVLEADLGYGILLWGTKSPGNPWYGYLRPHLGASSAGSYNSTEAALEFYPLSILGGRVGGEAVQNDHDYSAYDCANYVCRGRFYRSYVSADLTLGAGPVFGQVRWRRDRWTQAQSSGAAFVEPTNALALAGDGDYETVWRGMLGVKFNPSWSLLGVLVYAAADSDHAISRFPFALLSYHTGEWTIAAGGGSYHSAIKPEEASALMFLTWNIKPSLGLQ